MSYDAMVVGDLHLKISQFNVNVELLRWIEQEVHERKPSLLVYLGDTFDNHAVLRSEMLAEFRWHLDSVSKNVERCVVLVGNHDMYKPSDARYHALQGLKGCIGSLTVVDERIEIDGITYLPYVCDAKLFPVDTSSLVMAHQTFTGATVGGKRFTGVEPSHVSAELIVSGHVHQRQRCDKVLYPGTPIARTLDDVDQPKGILLLDSSTFAVRYIDSPFPLWCKREMHVGDSLDDVVSSVRLEDKLFLIIDGPRAEVEQLIKSKEFAEFRKTRDLTVRTRYAAAKDTSKTISSVKIPDMIRAYVDTVYAGSIDREVLYERALSIYGKQ